MNHFFAIELPDGVRDELAEQVSRWRSELNQFYPYRWVNAREYHITLKFLGNVSEAGVQRAVEEAQSVATAGRPFQLRLAQAGSFKERPTANAILWMGVRHDPDLEELARSLDISAPDPYPVITFGQPRAISPQQYKPHITIARGNFTPDYFSYRMNYEHSFPSWQAARFVLMQTLPPEQRANGTKARYNVVHTFPLGEQTP